MCIYNKIMTYIYIYIYIIIIITDRSGNSRVTAYQDWLQGPDYPGKSNEDLLLHTIKDLNEVKELLIKNDNI